MASTYVGFGFRVVRIGRDAFPPTFESTSADGLLFWFEIWRGSAILEFDASLFISCVCTLVSIETLSGPDVVLDGRPRLAL